MRSATICFTALLLLASTSIAGTYGNTMAQEVADVVFRDMDIRVSRHSGIYIGQTYKYGNPVTDPFFHDVIEMTGIVSTYLGLYANRVERINVVNFREFQTAHPEYYGAFKRSDDYDVETRKKILGFANALHEADPPIEYIVKHGEPTKNLLYLYFRLKENQTLEAYSGEVWKIARMRSDAFVEYCYAAAEVPIAKDTLDNPLSLVTSYGAATLVHMAAAAKLFPDNQRNWLSAADSIKPELIAKDSSGAPVSQNTAAVPVTFAMSDSSSGPGLLRIEKVPRNSEYGRETFTPYDSELLGGGRILTENIRVSTEVGFSPKEGLQSGYDYTATAYDNAGNASQGFNFKIPELSAININSANALYNNFKGISAVSPSTLERSHTFDFSEPMAGVSAVSIDGPQGNLWSQTFDPPVSSTSTSLSDMPTGDYTVQSFNSVGEETKTPFKVGDIKISVSTPASSQQYVYGNISEPGTFYFKIHALAESPDGLKKIQLVGRDGRLLAEKPVEGISAEVDLNTPGVLAQDLGGGSFGTLNHGYILNVINTKGNSAAYQLPLQMQAASFSSGGSYTESGEYKSGVYDITKDSPFPYLMGATTRNLPYNALHPSLGLSSVKVPCDTTFQLTAGAIGSAQFSVRTSDHADMAAAENAILNKVDVFVLKIAFGTLPPDDSICQSQEINNDGFDTYLCSKLISAPEIITPLKRYVQGAVVFNKTREINIPAGLCDEATNLRGTLTPSIEAGTYIYLYGHAMHGDQGMILVGLNIAAGSRIGVPLNSNVDVSFDDVTTQGQLGVTLINSRPPAGYLLVPKDTTFEINRDANLSFTGNANLSFKYDATGLTAAQEQRLKLAKVIDPATGKYEELAATLDTVNKTISANVTSFSKFMVLAPEYPEPQPIQSPNSVNGAPEMEFMSGAAASLPQYDMGGAAGAGTLAALKSANKLPVGNVYSLSTATDTFEPSGAIKMRYSGGVVAGLGVDEDSLAIYSFTESGDLYKLPYLTLNKDNKVLTARVPSAAYTLFAVLASSQQVENTPPSVYPDGLSPETTLSFGGATLPVSDGTYISSATTILFSASDLQVPNVVTSGVNITNYILFPESEAVEISTYTGPFTLPEGVRPLYYMSVDNAGNYEFPRATTIYIDATPPETELHGSDMQLSPETSFYATISGTVTLTAVDPLVSGARSGVSNTFYLVEKNFSECLNLAQYLANPSGQMPAFSGQPGTCENPLYSASFTLSPGTHTVRYLSFDNVWNRENPKTFYLEVLGDTVPPETFLLVNGSTIASGGSVDITTEDQIALAATDPNSDGMATGVKAIYYLIDVTTASCQTPPDLIGPAGTCRNPVYTGPFTLAVGTHTIYYTAEDNAGNMAAGKSAVIKVTPPVVLTSVTLNTSFVFLQIGSTQQFSATGMFSDGTSRALTDSDGPLWSVAHGTVAVISPGGLVTGAAYGKTQVRVSFGSLSADAFLFVYEPLPPSFSATGSMTVARHIHTATLLPNGNVLVAGGNNGSQILSSAELYNPLTGKFTATGSMSAPRGRSHTETLLPDGTVLLTGGISGNSVVATAEIYNPATGLFLTKGPMAAARYAHNATLLANGKVLITGGAGDNGTVSQAEIYDPTAGTFSAAGSLALARYNHTATLLPDGKVLVAGGLANPGTGHTATAEIYDPVSKTFSPTNPMNTARAYAKAVLLWTGEVLLIGGNSGISNVLVAETYNPASGRFAAAGPLSVGRLTGHTATLLPDGRVLVTGGDVYGSNNPIAVAEIYNPATRTFGATVPMSTGRFFHAAALLLPNGKVLVCGGYNGSSSLSTAELYNLGFGAPSTLESITVSPSSATIEVGDTKQFTASGNYSDGSIRPLGAGLAWSVIPATVAAIGNDGLATGIGLGKARITVSSGSISAEAVLTVSPPQPRFIVTGAMTVPRHIHTATLLPDGNVLVAGGNNGSQILSSAELYNPDTKEFKATGSMLAPRGRGHTETLLPGGNVLVIGGISGNTTVATAEVYNPITKEFSTTGSMAKARYSHNATLLANGKVLITGGAGDSGTVSQAELYDPIAGTFSAAGTLKLARYYHTATLLPDGKVLIAGGLANPGSGHTATAELYDPVSKTFSPTNPMSAARAYAKAVLLRTGEVLLIGGSNGVSNVLVSETYNPGSGSFSSAGSLGVGRLTGHTATLLADGKVLVAGGDAYGSNNALSVAEIYDPIARTFSATVPMNSGRLFHAAALLLPNGKVLVCGGYNGSSSISSSELFDSGFRGSLSPMLTSLLVEPSTASLTAGSALQFTAFGNFSNGSSRALGAADGLAWSIGHGTVAAVSEGGLVTGIAYGRTSVRASSGVYSAEAGLSVFYPPGVSPDGLVSVIVPDAGISVTPISTVTISTTPIFAAMSVAGLKPAMDAFYDFQPSGVQFTAPAKLRFIFDPALVEPAAVAIYYFDGVTWSSASIANQSTGLLAGGQAYVEGYISHSSIYAALYFKDILPPVTDLAFSGPNFGAKPVFISSFTALSLAAYDDAVTEGDRLGGVAARYYSVDSAAFTLYSGTFSIAGEGSHVVGYYSVDTAGNREEAQSTTVSVDVAPAVSLVSLDGTAGQKGWFISPVAVTLVSTDSLSGVAAAYYASGDGLFTLYGSSFGITTEGVHSFRHYAIDNIGNREAEKTINFGIDTSTPIITFAKTPGHNAAGWNNSPVSVVFSGTDAISGIAYCSPAVVLETEGFGQPVSGYCADYAGWSSTATLTLNIDRTAPALTISSPAAGNIFIATKDRIGVFFTAADNLNPSPKASARLMQVEDKGSPRGDRPSVIAVTYGQLIEPLDIDDGIWRLAVSATDFADNTSTLSGGTFEVVHDVLAPRTGQTMAGGASLTDGATTYITGGTVLKFSSTDDLVVVEDGIGLGVKKQIVRLKTGGLVVKVLAFENQEPKQGTVFNSTFPLASTSGLADGLYSLAYYAEDILGNIEAEKTFTLGLDNTAPVTAAELAGTSGENGWHVSAVSVKLTASDALSDVAGIYYQSEFNGQKSELRSYTEPFTVSAEGLYNVYFYAKDRLGNTETEKTIAFKIDRTDPLISAERALLANTYGWNNTAVTVSYLCADAVSGVKSCPPAAVLSGEGINQSASGEVIDQAGNSSSVTISGINIDKTAPASSYRVEGIVFNAGDGKTYLSPSSKLSLGAADPVSGGAASDIDVVEYHIDSSPFLLYTSSFSLSEGIRSVYYRSRDKAGNEEAGKSVELHIDGTSPVTSFNISGAPYIDDGTHYINSQSAISFAVTDQLVEGVASEVLITKYRLDGGAWQVYAASITIPAEGLHKLEYYSLDNVQNAEALRTLSIVVDNTSPAATLSVGEPVFEVFGLKIMTPETPVTLAASDPETAGPASGVKSIYYELTDAAGLGSGIRNYTEPFSTRREGVFTVSYWSVDNAGNSGTPLEAKLRVSSLRSDALDAVDGLEMAGSADIAGTVRSNATVSLGGNARILGDVYASTISISGKAQLTGQQHSGAATLVPTPLYMPEIVEIASNTNNNSLVPVKYLVNGRLVVPAKDELTLSTGVYYFNGIDLGGGARVGVNGKVDILVAGDISINGGASLNAVGSSSRLNIFLSTESALTFTGGGSLAAYVYAPYSQLKLAGNALLGGHYFVKRAIISGAGNILQAGEALPVAGASPGGGPKTKAAAMASGGYSVLAGPDPAFRLGEVYVFPNPAKGGEAPVFHIETGIADSVKINIYTISGRAAHEHTLTGLPAELDDGNGLSYAYEYVWRGHIPSGVYLYYIETQKAGQKLKKTGKFSVVR